MAEGTEDVIKTESTWVLTNEVIVYRVLMNANPIQIVLYARSPEFKRLLLNKTARVSILGSKYLCRF